MTRNLSEPRRLAEQWRCAPTRRVPVESVVWVPQERRVEGDLVKLWPFRMHLTDAQFARVSDIAKRQGVEPGELVQQVFQVALGQRLGTLVDLLEPLDGDARKALASGTVPKPLQPRKAGLVSAPEYSIDEATTDALLDDVAKLFEAHDGVALPPNRAGLNPASRNLMRAVREGNKAGRTLFTRDEVSDFASGSSWRGAVQWLRDNGWLYCDMQRAGTKAEPALYHLVANPAAITAMTGADEPQAPPKKNQPAVLATARAKAPAPEFS